MPARFLICCFALLHFAVALTAAGRAHRVIIMVWDGMRPDFVTEKTTPILWRLAQRGVFFRNHHPVYVSSTEVNGTALSTGSYPEHSSVIANVEYRPDINAVKPVGTEALTTVRKGDELYGKYLLRPTLAEIIQQHGGRTVVAGAKPVALLHDRAARPDTARSVTLFEGKTLPESILASLTNTLGPFPPVPPTGKTKAARDLWTTRALLGPLWDQDLPQLSILWLSEPDFSQHATSPGSPQSLAALRSSDRNLERVLQAVHARGLDDSTDILVVSDHAFSTVAKTIDVARVLRRAGFDAFREVAAPLRRGQIMVAGNGGSVLLYVQGHELKQIAKIVRYLQETEFAGLIFTRQPVDGAFTLDQAKLQSPYAPDILFCMRWQNQTNQYGAPGLVYCDGDPEKPSRGMHVTLSPFDLHNTLIAAGPDFKRGIIDTFPSGNIDVAPTVLWIFGIQPPVPMDGRVLSEALTIDGPSLKGADLKRLETHVRLSDSTRWQYLQITEFDGASYFEQGNSYRAPYNWSFPPPPVLHPKLAPRAGDPGRQPHRGFETPP